MRVTGLHDGASPCCCGWILQRGSDNTISVKIVDSQGLTAEGAISFAVSLEDPTVSITSPLIGQVVDPRQPLIVSADLTGDGEERYGHGGNP